MKKIIAICLAFAMLVTLAGCAEQPETQASATQDVNQQTPAGQTDDAETTAPAEKMKVAVVFASSGLGDKSFNDSLYNGMEEAVDEYGIDFVYSEPKDDAEYEPLIRGYADTGEYALIICLGYSQGTSLENVAPNYPDQNFVLLDATIDCANVACYTWRDYELGFLVGVVGGMLSNTGKVGFIGAFDIPLCNYGAAGLLAGARYVNPNAELVVDYAGGWAEVAGCKEIALAMHEKGVDVIYHTASAGGLGILDAGKENNFFTVAFDGNLNAEAPNTNIASAIRSFPSAAKQAIANVQNGTFKGGSYQLGVSDDALYLDFEGVTYDIPDDVMAAYEKAKADIASGKIKVPSTIEEAKVWTAK